MKQVYVSSTIKDLTEYRQVAIETLLRLEMFPIAMEYFNAGTRDNLDKDLRERFNRADIFVGIYAYRYGWQPPGFEESILEVEYNFAKEKGIPRLLFVIAPDLAWPLNLVEYPNLEKLTAFKERVKEDALVSFFRSVDDFQAKLVLALVEYRSGGKEDTINSIFGEPSQDEQYRCDIFMIMPFTTPFTTIYSDHILPVIERLGLTAKRGDNFFTTGSIMSDVWSVLCNCRLTLVECTGRNANVFYELGMSHTLNKPTILMTQQIDDIPFDIRHLRTIAYEYTPRGMKVLEAALEEYITKLL